MGSRRKRVRIQDEAEHTERRRRSSRITALEEKKQKEIERKIALALERKNNSTNNDKSNKEKGKATMVRYKRHPMQPRTSRHAMVPPKRDGRNNGTNSTVPKTEKRDMYWPPSNKSQFSEFLNVNKPNIQLNINPSNYKDSLLRFVEDLGPTAQRVAAHKLKALQLQQTLNDESPTQNYDAPNNTMMLSSDFPLFNRPLTIPGNAAQGNKNVNTIERSNSRPQTKSLDQSMSSNSFSGKSSIQHERPQDTMPSNNHSELPNFPPQVAYFPFELENPLFGLGTSYEQRDFQGSKYFNNSPFTLQENHEQVLHQASYGFPEGQMQLIDPLNPLGPFPPETPLGSEMNYYGGGAAFLSQPQEDIPQLLWDNDQQHNLALQLKHGCCALP